MKTEIIKQTKENKDKQIELIPEASQRAEIYLKNHKKTQNNFNKVSDLIEGFETPFGMELLSTVHWIGSHDKVSVLDEVIQKTYDWNERKRMFTPKQIKITWGTLTKKGWL